jgi:hypothetical protein
MIHDTIGFAASMSRSHRIESPRMSRLFTLLATTLLSLSSAYAAEEWHTLFNGKDLTGWRANVMPEAFSVVDGAIRVNAPKESAHLFFVGNL